MIIEIYKPWIKKYGSANEAIKRGFYIEWTDEKIKNTFNFGNGTQKDFRQYKEANKKYSVFMEV